MDLNSSEIIAIAVTKRPWHGQTRSGYGNAIPTRFLLTLKNGRRHRVLCRIHSNIGFLYIKQKGETLGAEVPLKDAAERMGFVI